MQRTYKSQQLYGLIQQNPGAAPEPLWGDVDGSGNVTVADAILLMRYALGVIDASAVPNVMLGDMDGNGMISITDSIALLRAVLGTAP
ncbi:MAG: dockerin type I repeat-containing protein [Clostridia bacterium]|nr:dockerin type I repeat-containing protein [Clostridia bacterium]